MYCDAIVDVQAEAGAQFPTVDVSDDALECAAAPDHGHYYSDYHYSGHPTR
jgi:hypothetical protein